MTAEDSLAERRERIEVAIARAVAGGHPAELYDPARYVMEGGGKRIRPLMVLLSAEMHRANREAALPAAAAVELFHNFTLVHDDIMDSAPSRRGRATVHTRWDQATAILVGDLLLGIAYEQLGRLPEAVVAPALEVFSHMVRRLCEGQSMDMLFESADNVSLDDYLRMIEGKTAALLSCCMELGAIVGGATRGQRTGASESGMAIGKAFQIQDDLLDLTANDAKWGKQVGGDLLAGKKTYPLLLALDRASGADRELLHHVLEGRLEEPQVPGVRSLMERLEVLKDTGDAVIFHSNAAIERLKKAPDSEARGALIGLVRSMQARLH